MKKGTDMKFDFKKRGRTLDQVSREEKEAALRVVTGFLTNLLAGKTQSGAFAQSWFGRKTPVEYFTEVAYGMVFKRRQDDGNWAWKESQKLTTLLCGAARCAKSHWEREWKSYQERFGPVQTESELPEPDDFARVIVGVSDEDDLDEEQRQAADEKADEVRRIGFDEVLELVKDDLELTKFVKGVYDLNDIRGITKRMQITRAQFDEIEAEVLMLINQHKKSQRKLSRGYAKLAEML